MPDLKTKIHAKMTQPALAAFATLTNDGRPWTRYVVVFADADLAIWFATFKGSRKVAQIAGNAEVHLTLGVTDLESAESYLQVEGRAEIIETPEVKAAVWYDHLANIFSGPEDPNYVVCKVTPYRIEFNSMNPEDGPEIWTATL